MGLSDLFARFSPKKRKAEQARQELEQARQELMSNAQKALHMKQEAGPMTNIPEHQTAHEGMNPKTTNEDHIPAREGYFEPELKRTKVARSGDAS